jgi:hypothetical protein
MKIILANLHFVIYCHLVRATTVRIKTFLLCVYSNQARSEVVA